MSKKILRISESQIPERLRDNRLKLLRKLGRFVINVSGWTIKGKIPDEERIVLIAAPHTSNWDFVLAMFAVLGLNIRVRWLGKHSLFKPGISPSKKSITSVINFKYKSSFLLIASRASLKFGGPLQAEQPEGI